MTKSIRREIQIPQPPAQVWHAITDRATLAEWMYPNDFEPRVGHRFTFHVPPNPKVNFAGLVVHCEVRECEPPQEKAGGRLAFSWSAGALADSQVSFHLEPDGDGTRLLFEHSGFDISQSFGEQAFKGAEYGWASMLKQLTAIIARLAAEHRFDCLETTRDRVPTYRAIGSSYLVRQSAGSERVGGMRVTVYPRFDSNGTITVELTDWQSGELHPYPMPDNAEVAEDAIRQFASENSFDLSSLDVKLDHFIFHDVDSDPRCYAQAARSAFRAALESLQTEDFPFSKRRNW
jgi:uncharacterized protein YndB with AHSA1/START domain